MIWSSIALLISVYIEDPFVITVSPYVGNYVSVHFSRLMQFDNKYRLDMILKGRSVIRSSFHTVAIAFISTVIIVLMIGIVFVRRIVRGWKMEHFIRANRVSRYNMRMIFENARILTIMLIVFLFIVQNLSSVLLFSKSVNISVTPYAFTFLVNDYICQFIIMEEKATIMIQNVTKEFKKQLVLNDVSINFNMGKIYGIIGRNGSRKTVLLKCICGLLSTSTGTITVNGKIIGKDIDFPENIGFIIENPGFL